MAEPFANKFRGERASTLCHRRRRRRRRVRALSLDDARVALASSLPTTDDEEPWRPRRQRRGVWRAAIGRRRRRRGGGSPGLFARTRGRGGEVLRPRRRRVPAGRRRR